MVKERLPMLWRQQGVRRLVVCLLLAWGWTSWTSSWLAERWQWGEQGSFMTMWLAQLLSVPLLATLLLGGWHALDLRLWRRWLCFGAYGSAFVLLLLAVAPGCLTEDSFYSFFMVSKGWWGGWYSPLHPALLTALLQIIPWTWGAPGVWLALGWALVFTLLHGVLVRARAPVALHWLLPLLALAPAQLQGLVLVLRDSFFSLIWVLWMLCLWLLLKGWMQAQGRSLAAMALVAGLLGVYRTDALAGVLPGMLLLWWCVGRRRYPGQRGVWLMLLPCLAGLSFTILPDQLLDRAQQQGNHWDERAKREYALTLIENPLGFIVRQPDVQLSGAQREAIEQVFRVEDLRQHYCAANLCTFYGGFWNRDSTDAQRKQAAAAAMQVFAAHPLHFLHSRWDTLRTVGHASSQTQCNATTMRERNFAMAWQGEAAQHTFATMQQLLHAAEGPQGARWWWSVPLFAAVALALLLGVRQAPATAALAGLLLLRTGLVFLAAPAGFTVYYLPLYLMVPVLLLLRWLECRQERKPVKERGPAW